MEASLKKVIFTCGGTAGHVNPAIALAQLMREKDPETEFLFVGAERGLEKDLIPKAGYDFRPERPGPFCGSSGRTWSSERGDTPASLW